MASITVENLSLSFPVLHGDGARSLKKTLFSGLCAAFGHKKDSPIVGRTQVGGQAICSQDSQVVEVQALCDVHLAIESGERVGLVGGNGAGKTTLLRVMAGIYEPFSGVVRRDGSFHALIDPQAGLNLELSGRENFRLLMTRLGWNGQRRVEAEAEIEAFAELGGFFDLPVRTFSAGMTVRLGFALATLPRPEILLMDEWFLAGDQVFQDKAKARLGMMVQSAKIVVITSHSLPVLRQWCSRIIWLDGGRVRADGPASDVLEAYEASFRI